VEGKRKGILSIGIKTFKKNSYLTIKVPSIEENIGTSLSGDSSQIEAALY
jgi:hypothetical protein